MGIYETLLIVLGLLFLGSVLWLVLTLLSARGLRKALATQDNRWRTKYEEMNRSWLTQLSQLQSGPLALVDKAMALVGTSDPLSFQQVQAMTPSTEYDEPDYDPRDEAEIDRIRERAPALGIQEDDLNGDELDALAELGITPEFFRAYPPAD